jgi:hypothetical protein
LASRSSRPSGKTLSPKQLELGPPPCRRPCDLREPILESRH